MSAAAQEWDMSLAVQDNEQANRHGDKGILVKFFVQPRLNQDQSNQQGRPIYDDSEYITIMKPGNLSSIVTRPVAKRDIARFQRQYQAFKASESDPVSGTLLRETPLVTRARAEELKHFNITTVEQLAEVNDIDAQKIMGLVDLKNKARAYLEASEKNEAPSRLITEIDDLKSKLKVSEMNRMKLVDRVDELQSQIKALHETQTARLENAEKTSARRKNRA